MTTNGFHNLRLCFAESRPTVQIMFMLRFLAGAAAGLQTTRSWLPELSGQFLPMAVAWFLASVASYLLNGIVDYESDAENDLDRPLANRELSLRTATRTVIVLSVAALGLAVLAGPAFFALTTAFLALGAAYSLPPLQLKKNSTHSILTVVAAGILTYAAGMLAAGGRLTPELLVLAVTMSLWMGLVGAIVKDFSDVEGDRLARCKTFTLRVRELRLRRMVSAFAFGIAALLLVAATQSPTLLLAGGVVLTGAAAVAYTALTSRYTDPRRVSRRPYRAFMWTQYAAHLSVLA
ncbi:UbiA prenyltransferase family protein [Nocardia tengchongensis]|uniref:UbiA prenyltransferase family protein n=1 Tax=Nocardia tengchongensis TaxID=2055889 RepID=UPI0036BB6BC3